MNKKKPHTYRLYAVIGTAWLILQFASSCENTNKPPHKKTQAPAPKSDQLQSKKLMDWPPLLAEGEQETLAPDLLTRNFYIIMDGSGSMTATSKCSGGKSKEKTAKEAIDRFASRIHPNDNLGLLIFNQRGTMEHVPLGKNNRKNFSEAVHNSIANGGTPMKTAITIGVKKLGIQARRQLGYGEYHLVIVTDGRSSVGQRPIEILKFALQNTPIVIHTIGFCISKNHSLNQPGKTYYKAADNPQALNEGLDSVLAEAEDFVIKDFEIQ